MNLGAGTATASCLSARQTASRDAAGLGLGPIAWEQLEDLHFDTELTVREIAITAFDGTGWRTVDRFRLRS